ncbi:MAG: 3-deoxy-D-manno-octulosonic acid transferase [Vampirovibrionales bacterium]|nr:3-deoxy-D-manno-octulosonic acid transferase [Vampirovibrionales bacterium]
MALSLWLYNLVLIAGVIFASFFWLSYLFLVPKARAGFWEKLGHYKPEWLEAVANLPNDKKRIWFHAVSVGEFNAIRPLINDLANDYVILISTTTKTAQELARRVYPQHIVFYCPFDFRSVLHRLLRHIKPDLVILTETELWPNMVDVIARRHNCPILLINGRISKRSFKGYQYIRPLMENMLHQINHCYMQSQGDANRILALGDLSIEEITVVGNLKFDIHPIINPIQKDILAHLLSFSPQDTVVTFASTHSGEDAPLLDVFTTLKKDFPELKLLLVPRHPERREEIRNILNVKGLGYSLRSRLSEEHPNAEDIVLVDSIGELVLLYSLSSMAVLGGSFSDKGGQNPLEPISQGIPVLFGPDMSNFMEISQLISENEAGYQAQNYDDLEHLITQLLTQPEQCATLVENGQQLLMNNRGTKDLLSIGIRDILEHRQAITV